MTLMDTTAVPRITIAPLGGSPVNCGWLLSNKKSSRIWDPKKLGLEETFFIYHLIILWMIFLKMNGNDWGWKTTFEGRWPAFGELLVRL